MVEQLELEINDTEKRPSISVRMCEWFDDHFYRIEFDNGDVKYYPSYTTKLGCAPKPFLARWRGDVGNREADMRMYDASNKGKRVHYACSLLLDGGIIIYNPHTHPNYSKEAISKMQEGCDREIFILQDQDEQYQVSKFFRWIKIVNPEIVSRDMIVADHEYQEAGTLDFLFKIKAGEYYVSGKKPVIIPQDGLYVADLKTGSDVWDEYYMQIAGYAKAYGIEQIAGGMIIHTNAKTKTGIEGLSTTVRTLDEMKHDYEGFRHIAAIWDRQNPNPIPQMIEFPTLLTLRESI